MSRNVNEHDRSARAQAMRGLAKLLGGQPAEDGDEGGHILLSAEKGAAQRYFVPLRTLLAEEAHALGITGPGDLFGGVVPHSFVATKAIVHPLVSQYAVAPAGWSHDLAVQIDAVVLRGYTAFSLRDAREAGRRMLEKGAVRIKEVGASAGLGQHVVEEEDVLDEILNVLGETTCAEGLVLEENLSAVITYSVGTSLLGSRSIAYWGTQRLTRDKAGRLAYGGTSLFCVQGGFEALSAQELSPELTAAIDHARRFDVACRQAYPGLFASRRNYDIAVGLDASGRERIAVLEQSWRAGGATGAEIAAFERFAQSPDLPFVRTSTWEIHGDADAAPTGATVYYSGVDPVAGPLSKYAVVEP